MLGGLREELQGTNVLVLAEDGSELTRLPEFPVDPEYLVETKTELLLSADGSVSGKRSTGGAGQAGARTRSWLRTTAANDLSKRAAGALSENLRGVAVTNVTSTDDRITGRCFITAEFSVPSFV